MTLMYEAIQDGICEGGLAEIGMPGIDGKLTRDERGADIHAIIEDLEAPWRQVC